MRLDAKPVYRFTVPIFGRGVAYDTSPEIMAEQLGFLFPALRDAAMRKFALIMFDETKRFADALGAEGEIDLPHAMNELTVKIASRCLIGQEVRDRVDTGFAEAYHELQNGINTLGFFLPRLPTAAHRNRDRARRKVAELFGGIMAARRRSGADPDDFMQTLMQARYKDGRALSDDEITGILLTVLFAGQHTSAVLATWTGLELLREPSYLARVRDEAEDVYGEAGAMSLDSLQQQMALDRAVRECERLHPPLILLIRKVLKPLRYGGRLVPAGTMAMVSPAVSHRLPHLFDDPERFVPDRFAPPASEDKQHHYALIGFGRRKTCVHGQAFRLPAAQGDLDRAARSLRLLPRRGVSASELRQLGDRSRNAVPGPLQPPLRAERLPMSGGASKRYDVAVVGAGPVGSLCALAHARKGARVALLEANPKASGRLAGEWLHPPAVRILRDIGVEVDTLPRSSTGKGFVVFPEDGSEPIVLPYLGESRGLACDHAVLVSKLREAVENQTGVDFILRRGSTGSRTSGSPMP